jgi:hypothetical protein
MRRKLRPKLPTRSTRSAKEVPIGQLSLWPKEALSDKPDGATDRLLGSYLEPNPSNSPRGAEVDISLCLAGF